MQDKDSGQDQNPYLLIQGPIFLIVSRFQFMVLNWC